MKELLVRLPDDLDVALRRRAEEQDTTISRVVRAALRAYLRAELEGWVETVGNP